MQIRHKIATQSWRNLSVIGLFGLLMWLLPSAPAAQADTSATDDPSRVVAMVGSYQITLKDVDTRLLGEKGPAHLYDERKNALDEMIDEYLIRQAAANAKLNSADYMKQAAKVPVVTESEARTYYDAHKAQIDVKTGNQPYDKIKPLLISALQQKRQREAVDAVIAKLRAAQDVQIALKAPRFGVATGDSPAVGDKNAPVQIVEFADFQCPYCRAAEGSIKQVRQQYGNKVRLVYMDFPLGFHPHALDASMAARCANEQGKFWPYHDALLADQSKLDLSDLRTTAAKLGLDTASFNHCLDSKKYRAAVISDRDQGTKLGLTGTPTFFLNGRELSGAQSPEAFSAAVDDELKAPPAPEKEAAR